MPESPTPDELARRVLSTADAIRSDVRRTPLVEINAGTQAVHLKLENLQHTGSFKVRGALSALLEADPTAVSCVTYSAGNHGRALARAARARGLRATVFMPRTAEPRKIELVEQDGAEVRLTEPDALVPSTRDYAVREGATFVHPFDDVAVMAGQGTVGLEILEDYTPDVVLVPVGGGGLLSGIAAVTTLRNPSTRVIAVEPERSAALADSLAIGRRAVWDRAVTGTTIADGLRSPSIGESPWSVLRRLGITVLTVSDDQIRAAMRRIMGKTNTLVEPSGAVALAGVLANREAFNGREVAAIVTGGNASLTALDRLVHDSQNTP